MIVVNARTSALDAVVFGVDVQSGDVRGDAPSYALVAFDGESVDRDVVSRRKLRRLIEDEDLWEKLKEESDEMGYCCFTPGK